MLTPSAARTHRGTSYRPRFLFTGRDVRKGATLHQPRNKIDCMCSRASSAASSPPMRQGNHCSFSNRVPKMKLQASEPSESLQSQARPCPKNRLSICRLGVVHRRLNGCNGAGNDIAQHHQPVLNGDLSDWSIFYKLLQERFEKAGSKTGA